MKWLNLYQILKNGGALLHPATLSAGGVNLQPNFQKGMAWQDLNF